MKLFMKQKKQHNGPSAREGKSTSSEGEFVKLKECSRPSVIISSLSLLSTFAGNFIKIISGYFANR